MAELNNERTDWVTKGEAERHIDNWEWDCRRKIRLAPSQWRRRKAPQTCINDEGE